MTQTQLCNSVNWNKCCIGDKGLELLDKQHKGHDTLCCYQELAWMVRAIKIMESHIPAGTLMSAAAVNACGLTNTEVGFAPSPDEIIVSIQTIVFNYNGVPLIPPAAVGSIEEAMDEIIAALSAASGVTWSYTQLSQFEFYLCAPYTQNGDTVELTFEAFFETSLGFIRMDVTLAGGVAPATPVIRTEADNCLTEQEIAKLSGRFCKIKVKSPRPELTQSIDAELRQTDLDIEFRN